MSMPNHAPIPELYVSSDSAQKLKVEAGNLPSWDLTARQVCDRIAWKGEDVQTAELMRWLTKVVPVFIRRS